MSGNRCGSTAGYRDHQDADEPTCRSCRDAQAAWQREYEKRRYLAGGNLLVDGVGTRRRLRALAALGWPSGELCARLGWSARSYASELMLRERPVQRATVEKVAALYDELSMLPGPSRRAALEAHRKGWVPPLAWDDESIDDPKARPYGTRSDHEPCRINRDPELEEQVLVLTRAGLSSAEIALRLRTNQRQVARVRARYREDRAS